MNKKGFTLIELLVVIAILAVLMSVVVITINPAEMLKKTRDTKRVSDLDALRTALNLYITDQGNLGNIVATGTGKCYTHSIASGPLNPTSGSLASSCSSSAVSTTASQAVDGTGWIPIPFSTITSGNPLSVLPVDPTAKLGNGANDCGPSGWHAYVFRGNSSTANFKIMANMESGYYSASGTGDVENADGGKYSDIYEVGSDMNL